MFAAKGQAMAVTDLQQAAAWPRLRFVDVATEAAYRRQFFVADRRNAALAILVFTVFKGSFAVFDVLVQAAGTVETLLLLRLGFVLLSLLCVFALLRWLTKPVHYDALMFAWALLAVLSNFLTIAQRPADHFGFLGTSPILIVLLFAFFRNRIGLQVTASLALIASDLFTLLWLRDPLAATVLTQSLATYLLAFCVGLIVSWQLKRTRRDYFVSLHREQSLAQTMQTLAYRDELTGVLNRRSFLLKATAAWQTASARRQPACLLMMDLDHFKRWNDTLGHEAGDHALRAFADLVCAAISEKDLFGRIGGEEFALLLPASPIDAASALANSIVAGCRALPLAAGASQRLTVSIGIAPLSIDDASLSHSMRRADAALYQAKAAGRDRVIVAAGVSTGAANQADDGFCAGAQ